MIATTNKENALWLLERLVPGSGLNNVGMAFQVDGRLRPDALSASLANLLTRYKSLRTVYYASDALLTKEVVSGDELKVDIEQLRLSGDQLEKDLNSFVGRQFDLNGQIMLRAGLAGHPDGDIFCVAVHHLVFDGASITTFIRDFVSIYDAVAAGQPVPLEVQEEGPTLSEPEPSEADLAYWRENLRGFAPDGLDLWCGAPRVQNPSMSGETVRHTVPAEVQTAVQRLQRKVRAPLATVLLAAYYALLAAHGAGPDLVIGTPIDIRGLRSSNAIGYHANVVPLRVRVDLAEGFRQLVRRTRDVFLAAMAHGDASVDDLSAELPRTSSSWQTTLYRHAFNFLPQADSGDLKIGGMAARALKADSGFSKCDLELFVSPSEAEICFRYCTEILACADVEALMRRYEALLIAADKDADRPVGELAGWSELDRAAIDAANDTGRRIDPATVVAAFQAHVLVRPEAPAVVDSEQTLTYQQVWEAAGAVRDLLKSAGIQAGDVIAVLAPRSRESVIAAFGAWLAGAIYLPLDAERDAAWIARRITHSAAKAVLTGSGVRLSPGQGMPPVHSLGAATVNPIACHGPFLPPDPMAPACLIYASEQGGQPAATVLSHGGIANLVSHFIAELAAGPATSTLALAASSTVGSLLELFLPLSSGGRVVAALAEARTDENVLSANLDRYDVGIVQLPRGVPARALQGILDRPGLRVVVGEQVSSAVVQRLLAAGCQLHAVYGAAETTGWAMSGPVDEETGLACGRPIANTRAFVLAPDGRELPIGVRGELCIAGSAVALSHQDDPRFRQDTRYGRYYPTGELARWRPDGSVERLGQIRRQAVIAGSPVNLNDVDAVLLAYQDVTGAAAIVVESPSEGNLLAAFAEVPGTTGSADRLAAALREHTLDSLRPAAVPELVICVDRLPRDAYGHIDEDALASLALEQLTDRSRQRSPDAEAPLVAELLELWRQYLEGDVTTKTNFFEAGGHSLLAARLVQDVEELTGIRLELSEIFIHPTPATLAARIGAEDLTATNRIGPPAT
jgi:non-ribosomal peptide synthetase component F/acyl carrier protein